MVREITGIPLTVFLNSGAEGREVIVISQPVEPHGLFAANALNGGILVGRSGILLMTVLPEGVAQIIPVYTDFEGGV